jgi:hypothetical protein
MRRSYAARRLPGTFGASGKALHARRALARATGPLVLGILREPPRDRGADLSVRLEPDSLQTAP